MAASQLPGVFYEIYMPLGSNSGNFGSVDLGRET